jgi:predicted HicB family RNase H-like nuclease
MYVRYMPTKRGRPPKAASERKADLFVIRLGTTEKQAFQQAASVSGLSLSSWARERLRMAAIRELEQAGLRAAFLADVYSQSRR